MAKGVGDIIPSIVDFFAGDKGGYSQDDAERQRMEFNAAYRAKNALKKASYQRIIEDPFNNQYKNQQRLMRTGQTQQGSQREVLEYQMKALGQYVGEYEGYNLKQLQDAFSGQMDRQRSKSMIGTGRVFANLNLFDILGAA